MKRTWNRARALGLIVALVLMIVGDLHPTLRVQACSGGEALTLDEMIDESSVIVKAKVRQIDIGKQNGIVQVESYFKGAPGPQYLLLVQTDPGEMQMFTRVGNGGTCADLGVRLVPGQIAYLFLNRDPIDGGYRLMHRDSWGISVVTYSPGEKQRLGDSLELTEDQFVDYVLKRTKLATKPPLPSTEIPRTAPLLIKTVKGSTYVLPVDTMEPKRITDKDIEVQLPSRREWGPTRYGIGLPGLTPGISTCWQEGCFVASANRMMTGALNPKSQIEWNSPTDLLGRYFLDGQAFALAPNALRIAVWNQLTLRIYRISEYQPEVFAEIQVSEGSANPLHAVWSADSTKLAYTDAQGLWLWSLSSPWEYKEKEDAPRLIIPKTDNVIAYPRYFSPQGRFLAIVEGNQNSTLDLTTGTRWPDGVVSPDDRYLMTTIQDQTANYGSTFINDSWSFAPLPMVCDFTRQLSYCVGVNQPPYFRIDQIAWLGSREFGYVACPIKDGKQTGGCQVYRADTENFRDMFEGIAFDWEPLSGDLVVLKDKSTITLGNLDHDLSKYLDGPIASIQWLPSLMSTAQIVRYI